MYPFYADRIVRRVTQIFAPSEEQFKDDPQSAVIALTEAHAVTQPRTEISSPDEEVVTVSFKDWVNLGHVVATESVTIHYEKPEAGL